ncbi:hypothetical protein QZH41_016273 [Actinostola sp. cb2023]|nr:hypothetical protein QZH41_016273 [Actinostola sp. cb2023]
MEVRAKRINHCTLVVEAPVYYPDENVRVHVRRITHEGSTSIGKLPFQFISRVGLIGSLLEDCNDPVTFMCEALGISSNDMIALDKALAVSFKKNIPPGFHLLGLRNHDIGNDTSSSLYPTLLHFASAFGLYHFTKDCLCFCPGVTEATKLRNCKGQRPSDMAHKGQFTNLNELLTAIEENGEESIYETMNENVNENENIYYTRMACQGYINLNLWQQSPNEDSLRSQDGEFYEDMTQVLEDETDPDGYMKTSHTGDFISDEIYTDMESGSDRYVDVASQQTDPDGYMNTSHTGNVISEEIYTDMESESDRYVDVASQQTDPDGYMNTSHTGNVISDEIYTDMESESDRYVDVASQQTDPDGYMNTSHTGNVISEEIYTDMESGSNQYVDVASQQTDGGYVSTSHLL